MSIHISWTIELPTQLEQRQDWSIYSHCVYLKWVFIFPSDLSHLLHNTLTAVQLPVEEDTRLSLLLSPSLSVQLFWSDCFCVLRTQVVSPCMVRVVTSYGTSTSAWFHYQILNLWTGCICIVMNESRCKGVIPVLSHKGVRQGCSLSPACLAQSLQIQ